jgi:hypothetical protein
MLNGAWDDCTMRNRNGEAFPLPPEFRTPAREMFTAGYWGPLRGVFPALVELRTRPKHPDKSAREDPRYRDQIILHQLMPFVDPQTGKWDGKRRIDPDGNIAVMPMGLRLQMHLMAAEGYWGNIRWEHPAMRDYGAEGAYRYRMLLSAITEALHKPGHSNGRHIAASVNASIDRMENEETIWHPREPNAFSRGCHAQIHGDD